jgi:hypothetical protein
MPTLDYEQMHNRSLETKQFTHKIGANVVLLQACATGAETHHCGAHIENRTIVEHFAPRAPA